jgi:hypothetical protein
MRQQEKAKEGLVYGGFQHLANDISLTPTTNLRQTLKGVKPEYNDIFNDLFANRTPTAVHLAQKTEARLLAIRKKFDLTRDVKDRNETIVQQEMLAKTKKDNLEHDRRLQKRRKLAIQARDFQFVQMKEKRKKGILEQ